MFFVNTVIGSCHYKDSYASADLSIKLSAYQCYDGSIITYLSLIDQSGYEWLTQRIHDTNPNATAAITIGTIHYTMQDILDFLHDMDDSLTDIAITGNPAIIAETYAAQVMAHHSHCTPKLKAYEIARFE